ncbi:MAG: putative toxin-antitoxin system toxin component, PIN family [Cytophagaceae bacterium]|nr:MAG: putative toxin-antitoxin system toxin component, PIN family [Cytophagaceae bacterium]
MNLVIDVNDFISALIGKSHRKKLELLLANTSIDVFASEHLLTELTEVAQRDKFKKVYQPRGHSPFSGNCQAPSYDHHPNDGHYRLHRSR